MTSMNRAIHGVPRLKWGYAAHLQTLGRHRWRVMSSKMNTNCQCIQMIHLDTLQRYMLVPGRCFHTGSRVNYHSMDYNGGGAIGKDGYSMQGPTDPSPSADALSHLQNLRLRDPRTIVKHLNEYVIGQDRAKKILAVAVFNHYNRVRANLTRQMQQNRQRECEVYPPSSEGEERHHAEHHHPTLPQEYYHTSRIQNVGSDVVPAERILTFGGPQQRPWLNPPTQGSGTRLHVEVPAGSQEMEETLEDSAIHDKSNVLLIGPTGSGKTLLAKTLAQILQVPFSISDATPFTQAGYVGEDVESVIHRLLQACDFDVKRVETGIVFIDEIDKISRRTDALSTSRDVSGEGVQQSLLRMLEGTVVTITDKSGGGNGGKRGGVPGSSGGALGAPTKGETYSVDTSNILFILSGAFIGLDKVVSDRLSKGSIGFGATLSSRTDDEHLGFTGAKKGESQHVLDQVEPADLVKYGLIPEFVGRLPVLANVNNLSADDLVRVLTEPKNSLVKQYEALFKTSQVELRFSQKALKEIARVALEKKTGARGLRRILEDILLDPMYDAPGSYIRSVVIDSKVVAKEKAPIYLDTDQRGLADDIIAQDDGVLSNGHTSSVASATPVESACQQASQG